MFAKSVFETAGCHTHIFTVGEIFAVRLGTPPIVDTVCGITRYCLLDTVLVTGSCPSDTCCVVHGVGAGLAGFPTSLPPRGLLMGPPL